MPEMSASVPAPCRFLSHPTDRERWPQFRFHIWEEVAARYLAVAAVSELCQIPPETPVKHRDLRAHSDAHRCCGKSLMGSALVRVGVRY